MKTMFGVALVLLVVAIPFQAVACDPPPPFDRVEAVLKIVGQDDCIEWHSSIPFVSVQPDECITM